MRKYRPCNGTEGMMFYEEWCGKCERDRVFRQRETGGCTILSDTLIYDVTDDRYPTEWECTPEWGKCTAFQRELTPAERVSKRARDTAARREAAGQQRMDLLGDVP